MQGLKHARSEAVSNGANPLFFVSSFVLPFELPFVLPFEMPFLLPGYQGYQGLKHAYHGYQGYKGYKGYKGYQAYHDYQGLKVPHASEVPHAKGHQSYQGYQGYHAPHADMMVDMHKCMVFKFSSLIMLLLIFWARYGKINKKYLDISKSTYRQKVNNKGCRKLGFGIKKEKS
jgi:hypothetical protein